MLMIAKKIVYLLLTWISLGIFTDASITPAQQQDEEMCALKSWPIFFGGNLGSESVNCVILQESMNQLIIAGNSTSSDFVQNSGLAFIMAVDLDANFLWGHSYYNGSDAIADITGCQQQKDSNYVHFVGQMQSKSVPVLLKIDTQNEKSSEKVANFTYFTPRDEMYQNLGYKTSQALLFEPQDPFDSNPYYYTSFTLGNTIYTTRVNPLDQIKTDEQLTQIKWQRSFLQLAASNLQPYQSMNEPMFIDHVEGDNREIYWIGQVHGRANILRMTKDKGQIRWGVELHQLSQIRAREHPKGHEWSFYCGELETATDGVTYGLSTNQFTARVVRLSNQGELNWQVTFSGTKPSAASYSQDKCVGIYQNSDSKLVILLQTKMIEFRTADKDYYDSVLILMSPDGHSADKAETISFRESTTTGYDIFLGNQALINHEGSHFWFGNTDGFATKLQTSGDNYAYDDGFVFKHSWNSELIWQDCLYVSEYGSNVIESVMQVETTRSLDQTSIRLMYSKYDQRDIQSHLGNSALDRFFYCNVNLNTDIQIKALELSRYNQTYIKHHGCSEIAPSEVEEYAWEYYLCEPAEEFEVKSSLRWQNPIVQYLNGTESNNFINHNSDSGKFSVYTCDPFLEGRQCMQVKECDGRSLYYADFCLNITQNTPPVFSQPIDPDSWVLDKGDTIQVRLPSYQDIQNSHRVHYFIEPIDGKAFPYRSQDQSIRSPADTIYIIGSPDARTLYLNATEYDKQYEFSVCVAEIDAPDMKTCQPCQLKIRKKPYDPLFVPVTIDLKLRLESINRQGEAQLTIYPSFSARNLADRLDFQVEYDDNFKVTQEELNQYQNSVERIKYRFGTSDEKVVLYQNYTVLKEYFAENMQVDSFNFDRNIKIDVYYLDDEGNRILFNKDMFDEQIKVGLQKSIQTQWLQENFSDIINVYWRNYTFNSELSMQKYRGKFAGAKGFDIQEFEKNNILELKSLELLGLEEKFEGENQVYQINIQVRFDKPWRLGMYIKKNDLLYIQKHADYVPSPELWQDHNFTEFNYTVYAEDGERMLQISRYQIEYNLTSKAEQIRIPAQNDVTDPIMRYWYLSGHEYGNTLIVVFCFVIPALAIALLNICWGSDIEVQTLTDVTHEMDLKQEKHFGIPAKVLQEKMPNQLDRLYSLTEKERQQELNQIGMNSQKDEEQSENGSRKAVVTDVQNEVWSQPYKHANTISQIKNRTLKGYSYKVYSKRFEIADVVNATCKEVWQKNIELHAKINQIYDKVHSIGSKINDKFTFMRDLVDSLENDYKKDKYEIIQDAFKYELMRGVKKDTIIDDLHFDWRRLRFKIESNTFKLRKDEVLGTREKPQPGWKYVEENFDQYGKLTGVRAYFKNGTLSCISFQFNQRDWRTPLGLRIEYDRVEEYKWKYGQQRLINIKLETGDLQILDVKLKMANIESMTQHDYYCSLFYLEHMWKTLQILFLVPLMQFRFFSYIYDMFRPYRLSFLIWSNTENELIDWYGIRFNNNVNYIYYGVSVGHLYESFAISTSLVTFSAFCLMVFKIVGPKISKLKNSASFGRTMEPVVLFHIFANIYSLFCLPIIFFSFLWIYQICGESFTFDYIEDCQENCYRELCSDYPFVLFLAWLFVIITFAVPLIFIVITCKQPSREYEPYFNHLRNLSVHHGYRVGSGKTLLVVILFYIKVITTAMVHANVPFMPSSFGIEYSQASAERKMQVLAATKIDAPEEFEDIKILSSDQISLFYNQYIVLMLIYTLFAVWQIGTYPYNRLWNNRFNAICELSTGIIMICLYFFTDVSSLPDRINATKLLEIVLALLFLFYVVLIYFQIFAGILNQRRLKGLRCCRWMASKEALYKPLVTHLDFSEKTEHYVDTLRSQQDTARIAEIQSEKEETEYSQVRKQKKEQKIGLKNIRRNQEKKRISISGFNISVIDKKKGE